VLHAQSASTITSTELRTQYVANNPPTLNPADIHQVKHILPGVPL